MAKYLVNDSSLAAVADAIRTKGGTTEQLSFPGGFVSAVEGIQAGGGGDVSGSILDGSITEYSNSSLKTIRNGGFQATKLVSADLPNVTAIGENSFSQCNKLKSVNIPRVTGVQKAAFQGCSSLVFFDLHNVSLFVQLAFYACTKLTYMVLRKTDGIATLGNQNALGDTKFFGNISGTGYVLVPTASISQYQQATNWSNLYAKGTCVFISLEEYTVDGTTTGAIDKEKLFAMGGVSE